MFMKITTICYFPKKYKKETFCKFAFVFLIIHKATKHITPNSKLFNKIIVLHSFSK